MDKNISNHDKKLALEAVNRFSLWDKLGKNTKYLEDWKTLQIRIGDVLRVQFTEDKEIVDVFYKKWHESHR